MDRSKYNNGKVYRYYLSFLNTSPPAYLPGENMTLLYIDIDIIDIIEIEEVDSFIHIKQLTSGSGWMDNITLLSLPFVIKILTIIQIV